MVRRGLILQATYRIERDRPVVQLWGKLESGESFLVRDDRQRPHFFILCRDEERARELGATALLATPRLDLQGQELRRVEVAKPSEVPALRERLVAAGIPCLEADVRFAMRYLIDRQIKGALLIHGEPRPRGVDNPGRVGLVFDNPEVEPATAKPHLTVLSIDIETDPRTNRLLSIALAGEGTGEVLLLARPAGSSPGEVAPAGARLLATEAELVRAFVRRIQEIDPDVVTGWNVIGFDLAFLERRAQAHGIPFEIGRGPGEMLLTSGRDRASEGSYDHATIPGRVVLDGMRLLRGAFIRMESYSLDFVSRKVLGTGKTISGHDRVAEILRNFREDREAFVRYNLRDAELVLEILERLDLLALTVERTLLTGMPPDRVSASVASFDFLYLSELSRRGLAAPSVGSFEAESDSFGGTVLAPEPGLHDNVLVFDFKSLYPSIIRTFEIDPLGYLGSGPGRFDDAVIAPNGAAFRRRKGILSDLLDHLFERREAAKERGDKVASQAIKILMNSFYGVLGTPVCRFYNPKLAAAITSFGREILLWSKALVESQGHAVLYGDTDSLFVLSGASDPAAARARGAELAAFLNAELERHVRATWGVESRLELELERLYLRLLFPRKRSGEGGAMKHYVGLTEESGVIFTGMEVVRRDWTDLARQTQRELYERFFSGRAIEDYLFETVERLRAGGYDPLLVYRKALRKELEDYTAATPPHVAAARKLKAEPGALIDYVITCNGPEPAAERSSPLDYEHYVEKQIRPIATPILDLLGQRFEKVIGDDTQLELF
ncbi:MAG TPA: DNA polymerase II [Thermoanaerobaculia bacterium]|nr:DNA polymerase II [Thermoanaerobaculia bacterium]